MKYLLYLSADESQLWGNDGKGWQPVNGEPQGPVWVVTDLAEESFAEIKTPRLFGRDRSSYIARQLAARFPDTPYRAVMTPAQEGDLISILAPTRHILFGIEAVGRLDAELDATPVPVIGVWPVSMLMALAGLDKSLPVSLFVVLPGPGTLRIVYLKNRTPILTRLIQTPNKIGAQLDEITRTLRHLENTQTVARDRQVHAVLLLGDADGFEEPMAAAHLQLVSLPRWQKKPPDDWRFPLFDLCVTSPAGQVAPVKRRADYLSARLRKLAKGLALAILIGGAAAAGRNLWSMSDILNESRTADASIQQLNARIAEVQQTINQFGVDPDTVRRAVALYDEKIASAPAMDEHLRRLAEVLASDPNLRVTDLQWHLLEPATLPCTSTKSPDEAASGAESTEPANQKHKIELIIEIVLPDTYGPRDRVRAMRNISSGLTQIDGLKLWQDATKDQVGGSLKGGPSFETATKPSWCMTLPGTTVPVDQQKEASGQ